VEGCNGIAAFGYRLKYFIYLSHLLYEETIMCGSEDEKYWQDFIDGDFNALSVLFSHNCKGLMAYGMKICPDLELVKDAVQEVFIQLIAMRHKLKLNGNINGLIYRLLRNKMIDEIKLINRSKRIGHLIFSSIGNSEPDAEHQYIDNEEEQNRNSLLTSALSQLSPHQKEAMHLKFSSGLTYEQIALVMGISTASSRTLIYRTLKQIRTLVAAN